jgi:O-6-methylguanine DNA methyltransferase
MAYQEKFSKKSFAERVRAVVRAIPRGSVMTYGDVARRAGAPGAARAVGTVMSRNFDPGIPCHRVIRADGRTGRYNRGADKKMRILRAEGVPLNAAKVVL